MTTSVTTNPSLEKPQVDDLATTDEHGKPLTQVVSFQLASELYGLNIMCVQEIILMGEITQIPEVPSYIRGIINLRGKVIPIVDLRSRFSMASVEATEHTRIIVVNSSASTVGFVVDAVSEVLRIDGEQIEPPPQGLAGVDQAYIQGLVKMDKKIMILLNIDKIMSMDDQDLLSSHSDNTK